MTARESMAFDVVEQFDPPAPVYTGTITFDGISLQINPNPLVAQQSGWIKYTFIDSTAQGYNLAGFVITADTDRQVDRVLVYNNAIYFKNTYTKNTALIEFDIYVMNAGGILVASKDPQIQNQPG